MRIISGFPLEHSNRLKHLMLKMYEHECALVMQKEMTCMMKSIKPIPFLMSIVYLLCFQIFPYMHFHHVDDHGMLLSAHPLDFMYSDSHHETHAAEQHERNHDENGHLSTDVHSHDSSDHVQLDSGHHGAYRNVKWGEPLPAIAQSEFVAVIFNPSQAHHPSDDSLRYHEASALAFRGRSPPEPA